LGAGRRIVRQKARIIGGDIPPPRAVAPLLRAVKRR
jgi:hypothetical protein